VSFDGLLISVATLKRIGSSKDKYGNVEKNYTTVASNIKCRLSINASIENELDRDSTTTTGILFTRYTPIYAKDVFEIDGITWEVVGEALLKQNSIANHHYEINVEKRKV